MIVYATYYDNIERAGYDPVRVVENWNSCDKRIVFASCEEEIDVLRARNVDADFINIYQYIRVPMDISIVQNACIDRCLEWGADIIVYTQGDQYITKKGDVFIHDYITHETGMIIATLQSCSVALYSRLWMQSTTTISSKQYKIVYGGDGTELNCYNPITSDESLVLDLGYLGTEQYYKKMRNHNHIWPDTYKTNWMKLYEADNLKEAVRVAYKSIATTKQCPIQLIDLNIYEDLLQKMNLLGDYEFCANIARKV